MPGTHITLDDNTPSALRIYIAEPTESNGLGLVLLQEWWGLVDHIREVADRLAEAGFTVCAPDLFGGKSTTSPDEASRQMMALNIAQTSVTLGRAIQHLRQHSKVSKQRVGVMGFCMGGQLALFAGCEHAEDVNAVVNFYGIHPEVKPQIDKLKCPVLAHFAIGDEFVPIADARQRSAEIRMQGKSIEMHEYHAGHAFFNDSRPEAYHAEAATLAWERSLDFLRRNMDPRPTLNL